MTLVDLPHTTSEHVARPGVPQRLITMVERRILTAWLDYRSADCAEACLRERNWLALLLQMQERRRTCPRGIEAHVVIVMLYDRARYLRN